MALSKADRERLKALVKVNITIHTNKKVESNSLLGWR